MGPGQKIGFQGAAIPKIVFGVEKLLDSLAASLPDQAGKIDSIKSQLRDVMVMASQGGATRGNPPQGPPGQEVGL